MGGARLKAVPRLMAEGGRLTLRFRCASQRGGRSSAPLRRSARVLAALNTPPAENVPCRKVNLSLGTAFHTLRANVGLKAEG